jgi:hypothetical protein
MASTLSQQAAAIEVARRILVGGVKPPKPASSEAKLPAEQLLDAANSLREKGTKQ